MADFPGEGGRDLLNDPVEPHKKAEKLVEEAVKKAPRAERVPPLPAKSHKPLQVKPRPRSDIDKLAKDFNEGVVAIQRAIARLAKPKLPEQGKFGPRDFGHIEGSTDTIKDRTRTILEREMRTVLRVSEKLPIPSRHIPAIARDFQRRAKTVFEAKVPQTLAAIMKIDRERRSAARTRSAPQSSVALRPGRGSPVESLMKVAKSIRAGRLPFVPAETRKQAQQLIDSVVGRSRGRKAASLDRETERLIERYKLVPLAVRNSIAAERAPNAPQMRSSERLDLILREVARPANREAVPIAEHHARQLEPFIPRFQDEGAVYGGPAIVDAGETRENVGGMDVIYREGSTRVSSPEAPSSGQAGTKLGEPIAAEAPQAASHGAPAADIGDTGSRVHGGLGTGRGGGTVGAAGGPVKITGELTIPGMAGWVAKVEGFLHDV